MIHGVMLYCKLLSPEPALASPHARTQRVRPSLSPSLPLSISLCPSSLSLSLSLSLPPLSSLPSSLSLSLSPCSLGRESTRGHV